MDLVHTTEELLGQGDLSLKNGNIFKIITFYINKMRHDIKGFVKEESFFKNQKIMMNQLLNFKNIKSFIIVWMLLNIQKAFLII